MEQSKEIKVYGTLMNHTIDSTKEGVDKYGTHHYDAVAYAWQLYDDKFGQPIPVDNYQDVINKRLTAISYIDEVGKDPCTIIKNPDGSDGTPYMLIVEGNTNIGGDLHVDENLTVEGDTNLGDVVINGDISGIDLGDLDDVDDNVSDPSNEGKVLKFVNNEWVAADSGIDHLNDIGDVNANQPDGGAFLIYDDVNEEWKPSDITISQLMDRIEQLEASILWEKDPNDTTKIRTKKNNSNVQYSAVANKFFDSSVQ